jgi:hypothetical protein
MPRPSPKVLIRNAAGYLKSHPEEIVRAVRGAFGLRFGVPLDALRYLAAEFWQGSKAPKDVVIEARPPGIGLEMTVRAMGSTLRVSLTLFVEELEIGPSQTDGAGVKGPGHAKITARIADLHVKVLDGDDTPIAGLIKSGALDLSKPGNLMAYMPKRPDMVVEAADDRVVLDLMRLPKLAQNPRVRRALEVVSPVFNVAAIRTRDDHLDVHFKADPSRIGEAFQAATSAA